jgi:hypothetical protein
MRPQSAALVRVLGGRKVQAYGAASVKPKDAPFGRCVSAARPFIIEQPPYNAGRPGMDLTDTCSGTTPSPLRDYRPGVSPAFLLYGAGPRRTLARFFSRSQGYAWNLFGEGEAGGERMREVPPAPPTAHSSPEG